MQEAKPYEKRWILAASEGGDESKRIMKALVAEHPDVVHVQDAACGFTALHWAVGDPFFLLPQMLFGTTYGLLSKRSGVLWGCIFLFFVVHANMHTI